jgi:hypothetical protein
MDSRVVIDDVDVGRLRIFELIEDLPGVESRCIGVLTKCDRKQEGSDEWVYITARPFLVALSC